MIRLKQPQHTKSAPGDERKVHWSISSGEARNKKQRFTEGNHLEQTHNNNNNNDGDDNISTGPTVKMSNQIKYTSTIARNLIQALFDVLGLNHRIEARFCAHSLLFYAQRRPKTSISEEISQMASIQQMDAQGIERLQDAANSVWRLFRQYHSVHGDEIFDIIESLTVQAQPAPAPRREPDAVPPPQDQVAHVPDSIVGRALEFPSDTVSTSCSSLILSGSQCQSSSSKASGFTRAWQVPSVEGSNVTSNCSEVVQEIGGLFDGSDTGTGNNQQHVFSGETEEEVSPKNKRSFEQDSYESGNDKKRHAST